MSDAGPTTPLVMLVEDHRLLADSLSVALRGHGVRTAVARIDDAATLLADVRAHRPDLVLLDLDLGPGLDGEGLVAALRGLGAEVLVLTGTSDLSRAGSAIEAGALGHLDKAEPFSVVLAAVLGAARGEAGGLWQSRHRGLTALQQRRSGEARSAAELGDFARLSAREGEVLAALCEGSSVEVIAAQRVVSTTTVRSQVRAVLTKLGVSSQLAAVARANRTGWRLPTGD